MAEEVRWFTNDNSYPPKEKKKEEGTQSLLALEEGDDKYPSPLAMGLLQLGASMMRDEGWRDRPITLGESLGKAIPYGIAGYYNQDALNIERESAQAAQDQAEAQAMQAVKVQQQSLEDFLLELEAPGLGLGSRQKNALRSMAKTNLLKAKEKFLEWSKPKEEKPPTAAMLRWLHEDKTRLSPEERESRWQARLTSAAKYFTPDQMELIKAFPKETRDKTLDDWLKDAASKVEYLKPEEAKSVHNMDIADDQQLMIYPNGEKVVVDSRLTPVQSIADIEQTEYDRLKDKQAQDFQQAQLDHQIWYNKQTLSNWEKDFVQGVHESDREHAERVKANLYQIVQDGVRNLISLKEIDRKISQFRETFEKQGVQFDKTFNLQKAIADERKKDSDRRFKAQEEQFKATHGLREDKFGFTKEQALLNQQNIDRAFTYREGEDKTARDFRIQQHEDQLLENSIRNGYTLTQIENQAKQFRERMDREGVEYDKTHSLKEKIFERKVLEFDRTFEENVRQYEESATFKESEAERNQSNKNRLYEQQIVEYLALIQQRGIDNEKSASQVKLAQEKFIERKKEFALTHGLDVDKFNSSELRFQANQSIKREQLDLALDKFDYTKTKDKKLFDQRVFEHMKQIDQWAKVNGIAKERVDLQKTIFQTGIDSKKREATQEKELNDSYRDNVKKLLNTTSDISSGIRDVVNAELEANPVNAFKILSDHIRNDLGKLMPVPVVVLTDYTDGLKIRANVARTFKIMESAKGKKGLGIVGGRIPNLMMNQIAVMVRASIALLASLKRHELTGVAMSQYEAKLMSNFVPKPSDTIDTIYGKLNAILDDTNTSLGVIESMYTEANGYKPLPRVGGRDKDIGSL